MRNLLHAFCAGVFLIADVGIAFVLSVCAGGTLVSVASTDSGTSGGKVPIALVVGVFSFLLSLMAVYLRAMIDILLLIYKEKKKKKKKGDVEDAIVDEQMRL